MNLFSLLGQTVTGNYTDDTYGAPVQRIQNAYASLLNAINVAVIYNNTTRADRLNAFKTPWESKAQMVWGKLSGDGTAQGGQYSEVTKYSLDLAGEVATALAVSD